MNKLITLILVCCFAFNLYAEQLPAKQFSHPERIRYDQHCFTIEGRDIFILSAAFHYFRVPQELWRDRFRKIKEAGFNTVETYVPWNWHERTMPRNVKDYSQCDFDDLKAWLKMAHEEFGLYTIVRPGPFILQNGQEEVILDGLPSFVRQNMTLAFGYEVTIPNT